MLNDEIEKKIKIKNKNILKNYENHNKKTLDIKISTVDCYSKIQNLSGICYLKVRECHNSVCKIFVIN